MISTAAKIRIARLLYRMVHSIRRPFGRGDRVRVRRRGVWWELDLREGIDLTIYLLGAFEIPTLRVLKTMVRDGATVLDIGANIGAHTLHLARLVGDKGQVIAFEPTDFAIAKLQANLKANPSLATRVRVHQTFLVSSADQALVGSLASSWPVDGTAPDHAQMGSRSMAVAGAKAFTVDSVMEAAGNPRVQLIKMDVDGQELEVLQGAQSLIARHRPIIVMELAPYVFQPTEKFDEMVDLLFRAGYGFRTLGFSRELPRDPLALRSMISHEASVNVVALPDLDGERGKPGVST